MFHAWIIFGPTASGKTELAFRLAKEKGADLLSFDSRQIYQGMAIGTGQDIPADYRRAGDGSFQSTADPDAPVLFGFDLITPDQPFSIRHYYEHCRPIIEQHRRAGKPLVLVGGSWPYAQVLFNPPASLLAPRNPDLRAELEKLSVAELQQKLGSIDPDKLDSFNLSDQANRRRLIRAIEVAAAAVGLTAAPLLRTDEYSLLLHSLPINQIESRIKTRIEQRLAAGVLEETQILINQYPDWSTPAFSATGYRFLRDYLEKKISLAAAKQLWFNQERQYAKRQITWLKKLASEKRYNLAL